MTVPGGLPPATPNSDSLAVASDGSIFVPVVDIEDGDPADAGIVHLTSSGHIDHTFGDQGLSALTQGSAPIDAVATTDGGVVVELQGADGGAEFLKIQSNGKLDTSFGDFHLLSSQEGDPDQLVSSGDGKFFALTPEDSEEDLPPDHDFPLARLNANGTLDPTFGGDGWVQLPQQIQQQIDSPMGIAVAPDGSIIAVGSGDPAAFSDYAPLTPDAHPKFAGRCAAFRSNFGFGWHAHDQRHLRRGHNSC